MIHLNVDQGDNSGWCIQRALEPRPIKWGVAKSAADRTAVFDLLLSEAMLDTSCINMVLEDHSGMPLVRGTRHDVRTRERGAEGTRSTASLLGQGANAGRWKEQAELRGIPKSHVRKVTPAIWKRALLGRGWEFHNTDEVRAESVRVVKQRFGIDADHDAAAAILIAAHQALALPAELEREKTERRLAR